MSEALTSIAPPPLGAENRFATQVSDETVLREAWYRVQRGGRAPGVDGVTIAAFRPSADRAIAELGKEIALGTYRPTPLKLVQIPKADGGWRRVAIPTVRDRLAQAAAALVLHARAAAMFSNRSFAYRPFLGPRRAALYLRSILARASWVVTADIEKFFDNVDHHVLAGQLHTIGIDADGVQMILRWLTTPFHDGGHRYQPIKGLPQGSPLSPSLANLYLSGFDLALESEHYAHVRYADDFVVALPDEGTAQRALTFISSYLASRLRLRIKASKTQYGPVDAGFTFVGFAFTTATWTIPTTSVERFQETVNEIFASSPDEASLRLHARAHNDLVRGWRNYYQGHSPEMDAQLRDLDAWRERACRDHLERAGQSPDAATVWFDRLLVDMPPATTPPHVYAHDDVTDRGHDALPDEIDEWHRVIERPRDADPRERLSLAARRIHDATVGQRQESAVLVDGVLRVPTFGAFLTTSHGLLVVRRRKQVTFETSMDEVTSVTIEGDGVVLSTNALAACSRHGIPLTLCRASGRPLAWLVPARGGVDATLARRQVAVCAGRRGSRLAIASIAAKLANQRALLLYRAKYRGRDAGARDDLLRAATAIDRARRDLAPLVSVPLRRARTTVFLIEARAAGRYWHAVAQLIPDHFRFHGRVGRGATDVPNKALNYGYAILLNHVWMAIQRAGLHPALGVLHSGRRRGAALAFDLMEPFRQPVVDRVVFSLIGRRAHLCTNARGALTLRTRGLLRRALAARLTRAIGPGDATLSSEIDRAARRYRSDLRGGPAYRAYRMPW
jgi:group II intron reverse transcriptase/maturase/CRISPR-associated endonuclease Cas1